MMLAAIAALVGCDALAAMEYFDHATGDTHVDIGADQFMGNRVAVVRRLDVIIDIDDRKAPFGKLIIAFRQRSQRRLFDACEQIVATKFEAPIDVSVDALEHLRNGAIGFLERKERLMSQSPEDVGLCKADAGLNFCFVTGR